MLCDRDSESERQLDSESDDVKDSKIVCVFVREIL